MRAGFKATGSQFVAVAGGAIDLCDITVTGYDKEAGSEEEVNVQKLDKDGNKAAQYIWIDVTDGDDVYYGWIDSETGDIIESGTVYLDPGEGLWVDAPSSDYNIQTAGEVTTALTIVNLRGGFKMVANPTPVSIDLNNVVIGGYDAEVGSEEEVNVQKLDKDGNKESQYIWIDVTDGDDVYYGWIDSETGDIIENETVMVAPGEGLWVDAPSTDYTITFPKAL